VTPERGGREKRQHRIPRQKNHQRGQRRERLSSEYLMVLGFQLQEIECTLWMQGNKGHFFFLYHLLSVFFTLFVSYLP